MFEAIVCGVIVGGLVLVVAIAIVLAYASGGGFERLPTVPQTPPDPSWRSKA